MLGKSLYHAIQCPKHGPDPNGKFDRTRVQPSGSVPDTVLRVITVCSTFNPFWKVLSERKPVGSQEQLSGTLPEVSARVRLNFPIGRTHVWDTVLLIMICPTFNQFLRVLTAKAPVRSWAQLSGTLPEVSAQVRSNFPLVSGPWLGHHPCGRARRVFSLKTFKFH